MGRAVRKFEVGQRKKDEILEKRYNWDRSVPAKSDVSDQLLAPEFDDILLREIYARTGQTLLLPCTVKNLGNKVVSWIRSKDLHILTSGRLTFSGDSRFESVHSDSSGDFWGLRIRGVYVSDSGQYECQVNTEPKMSLAIKLSVAEINLGIDSSLQARCRNC
ncbi:hypothetical protein NQ315_002974 [Exocentrus adspersus]|uniref:Ig-like domain-containing protein n=1 Tax=Exocentrus adspersus TaxID=1586481 RepID=A0AAV8W4T5_9CUCU|nr:hypothetical protein NQ315_002974 [Exocentrus adspersus]